MTQRKNETTEAFEARKAHRKELRKARRATRKAQLEQLVADADNPATRLARAKRQLAEAEAELTAAQEAFEAWATENVG